MKETLAKLQSLYDLTTGGKWSYEEKFTFNTHTSKKEIKGGFEKARMRVAVLTKSADGRFFYRDWETDRKSTRLNSSHSGESRMPSSA